MLCSSEYCTCLHYVYTAFTAGSALCRHMQYSSVRLLLFPLGSDVSVPAHAGICNGCVMVDLEILQQSSQSLSISQQLCRLVMGSVHCRYPISSWQRAIARVPLKIDKGSLLFPKQTLRLQIFRSADNASLLCVIHDDGGYFYPWYASWKNVLDAARCIPPYRAMDIYSVHIRHKPMPSDQPSFAASLCRPCHFQGYFTSVHICGKYFVPYQQRMAHQIL